MTIGNKSFVLCLLWKTAIYLVCVWCCLPQRIEINEKVSCIAFNVYAFACYYMKNKEWARFLNASAADSLICFVHEHKSSRGNALWLISLCVRFFHIFVAMQVIEGLC